MQSLAQAIETCQELRTALDGEVGRAQGERVLMRKFDVEGLLRRATLRGEFNANVMRLEGKLAAELSEAGRQLGCSEVSLETLGAASPKLARVLSDVLAEIRALAGALAELDELNRRLAQRATACVRGYLGAVSPATEAYDRRGTAPDGSPSTFSGRA